MSELLRFGHKAIRSLIIRDYMAKCGYDKAVCFSCGNAARSLEETGIDTLHIGEQGVLKPTRWFTQAEIHRAFPNHFDATSGNLPIELMYEIGKAYKTHLGKLPDEVYVPTGSGETIVCLKMVYPDTHFVAVYNLDKATEYSPNAPLNGIVKLISDNVIMDGKEEWTGSN